MKKVLSPKEGRKREKGERRTYGTMVDLNLTISINYHIESKWSKHPN